MAQLIASKIRPAPANVNAQTLRRLRTCPWGRAARFQFFGITTIEAGFAGRTATAFPALITKLPPQKIQAGFASRTAVVFPAAVTNIPPQIIHAGFAARTGTAFPAIIAFPVGTFKPAAVWAVEFRPGLTYGQAFALMAAVILGKSRGHPGAPIFSDCIDTIDRVAMTVDANGNRSAVELHP